jgi:small subunit ribosomal protein S5
MTENNMNDNLEAQENDQVEDGDSSQVKASGRPDRKRGAPQRNKKPQGLNPDIEERVVAVNRVAKVVKGGRRFSFSALMIVGDKKGNVGYGLGKAKEVPEAIRKATHEAHRNMIHVPVDAGTIPHATLGCYDSGKILFKPAADGTGIKAAGACRSILELAGIKNVLTKSLRGNNPHNIVKATFVALKQLRSVEKIANLRGIDIKRIRIK